MRWAWVVLLGALCAGCVATGTEEETQPPEEVGTAAAAWGWWGPVPSGFVADPFAVTVEELVIHKAKR